MANFQVVDKYLGYENKQDKTNIAPGTLVSGSKNVISTDGARIASRQGYTLLGPANSNGFPIVSSYEWNTHYGTQRALRSYDNRLEFYNSADSTWYLLATFGSSGSGQVQFNFAEFWDTTNIQDALLFVNGSSNIYSWTGAVATFASAASNTITLQGTKTFAQLGFLASGSIIIGGVTYTYTGGFNTTTLTGVTPDPTAGSYAAGTLMYQAIGTQANSAISSTNINLPSTFANSLIQILNNQVYLGSFTDRSVYVSKANSYSDFGRSAQRLPGEGEKLTLDGTPVGFVVQEEAMYITAGLDQWYQTLFTLSSDLSKESLTIKRLKTGVQKAAQSQSSITNVVNDVVFVSNEPTFDTLGRVEQISTPQNEALSDRIKLDFKSYNFANCHALYFQNNIYLAVPASGVLLIYNLEKSWWEPPQTMPIRRLAIIGGKLCGHSSQTAETYTLFSGYNDNGNPINAVMALGYMNYGDREKLKTHDEYYCEGYMSQNTKLTLTLNYDYGGFTQVLSKQILGTDTAITFTPQSAYSLGTHSLAEASLAGGGGTDDPLPPKFRAIRTFTQANYWELQAIFSSNDVDQRWEILASGPDVRITGTEPASIKD